MIKEDNNDLSGDLPKVPHPRLIALGGKLAGHWKVSGDDVSGTMDFEWMEGGHFLVHRYDLVNFGEPHRGVEYIGWNEKTRTLRSRLFGTDGSRFTYTWHPDGEEITTWFGEPGADNYSTGCFVSPDRFEAAWHWPPEGGGPSGYRYTLTRG